MTATWDSRIAAFWENIDDSAPERAFEDMRTLLRELPPDSPEALYEWASLHDFLGMEREAVPLYEAALSSGLSGDRKPQAIIQLASSLRNIGRADEAVQLLIDFPADTLTGDASQAFLALALRDCGRVDEALQVSLLALSRTLPMYRRSIEHYVSEMQANPE